MITTKWRGLDAALNIIGLVAAIILVSGCTPAATDSDEDKGNISEAILQPGGDIITRTHGNVNKDSLFQVGSISKFACALAAFDMEKEGLVSLDDPVAAVLPGYTGSARGDVKLIHLLQNRSGLEDGVITAFRQDQTIALQTLSPLDAANSFASGATKFTPGSAFDYIVSNWVIVQAVLEKADNAPVAAVLKKRVFDKAGMTDAGVFVGVPGGDNIAPNSGSVRPVPNFLSCAGGVMATARDAIKLVRHPYHSAGFSPADLERFTAIATEGEGYALGGRYNTITIDGAPHTLSWQNGSNGPYKSIAVYDPVLDAGYAALTGDNNRALIADMRDRWLATLQK